MYKHFSNAKCLGTKFARKFCFHFKKNEMRTKCAKMLYEFCTIFVRFLSPRAGTRDENQKRVTIQLASSNVETRPTFGPWRPSRGAVHTKRSMGDTSVSCCHEKVTDYRNQSDDLTHAYLPPPNVHSCTLGMPYCMDWARSVTTTTYMRPTATTAYLPDSPNIK